MRSHADHCPVYPAEEDALASSAAWPYGHAGCRLRDLPDGVRTHVRALRGCQRLRSRLYSLGLIPGVEITVRGHGEAGCRVEVRDTCVVLDRESADSVLCDAAGAA